ncbi:hypothetical protein PCE1_002956 [Barthelona sp. PCE]
MPRVRKFEDDLIIRAYPEGQMIFEGEGVRLLSSRENKDISLIESAIEDKDFVGYVEDACEPLKYTSKLRAGEFYIFLFLIRGLLDSSPNKNIVLSSELYRGTFWESRDGGTVATVHFSCIKVFSIPSLEEIFSISTFGKVTVGCLSFDGQFLAFYDDNEYHTHDVYAQTSVSCIGFADGNQCWVNSEFLFVRVGTDHIHKFCHDTSKGATVIRSFSIIEEEKDVFRCIWAKQNSDFGNNCILTLQNDEGSLLETYNHSGYIFALNKSISSARYILLMKNSFSITLINRLTKKSYNYKFNTEIESSYFSPDERHFIVAFKDGIAKIQSVKYKKNVTTVPSWCTGPSVTYEIVNNDIVVYKTPSGSFFISGNSIIAYDPKYFVETVTNGYLLFFSSRVVYMTKKKCFSKNHDPHNKTIVKVTKDADSVFHAEFDDGTFMFVEWSQDGGFGRILCDSCNGNVIDLKFEICDLKSEMEVQKSEMEVQKSEMEAKFQITFDALSQLLPNSGSHEFSELTEHVDSCAAAIRELKMPLDSLFEWLSSNPSIRTFEQIRCMLERAISYEYNMNNIIFSFHLEGSLSNTFFSRFSDLAAQFPIAKVLKEKPYALKLDELKCLDVYFNAYDQCVGLKLNEVLSVLIGFTDKRKALDSIGNQVHGVIKSAYESIEAQNGDNSSIDPLHSLREQLERHRSDINACACSLFTGAKAHLLNAVESKDRQLKDAICELTIAVNLDSTLEELQLSTMALPDTPKIAAAYVYLDGKLKEVGLQNCALARDDLFIKCICVSKEVSDLDVKLDELCRELHVLTKRHPYTITLKNVVLVPEMHHGNVSLRFVCLELKRAQYNLEQYMNSVPDLQLETRNRMAHQLVMGVFTMHTNNIILRDLNPRNVLVFESDGNPVLKLCGFNVSADSSQAQGTSVVGTDGYRSSEVAEGHEHTFLSDVFSLGRTIAFIYALDRTNI